MDPAAILGTRQSPVSGRRSILGWTLCYLCFSACHLLAEVPPVYLAVDLVYKNTVILRKVFQMLGELLQNYPALQNDSIQNVANF